MDRADEQHANLLAFQAFLDSSKDAREPVVELTAFRRLCARGVPDHPRHLRPLAYSLLLQTLPAQKGSWKGSLRRRRKEYHALVEKFMHELESMPAPSSPLHPTDKLLKGISAEVERAISRFPYLKTRTLPSESSPLSPPASDDTNTHIEQNAEASGSSRATSSDESDDPVDGEQVPKRPKRRTKKLLCRRATMKRLEMIAEAEHRRQAELRPNSRPPSRQTSNEDASWPASVAPMVSPPILSPRITLSSEPSGPMLSRLEGKRPPSLTTPQLSLSLPDPQAASPNSTSSTPLSPITLLSPKPIPAPGSMPFSSLSGQLLQPDTHAEVLVRSLYIFTRTSPNASVQGLVDILAVLYSVYLEVDLVQMPKKRKSPAAVVTSTGIWVEEQAYFAFVALTQRFKALIFDETQSNGLSTEPKGEDLVSSLARLSNQLKWADQQLWTILNDRNLLPSTPLYAYRWLATLYTQDFSPQVILRLWDFILAESFPEPNASASDPLIDIGVAILIQCKRLLMGYAPVPNTQSRRGLWGDVEEKAMPEEHDISRDLEILRSPPLSQIGGIAVILDTAFELRTARLVDQMESMAKAEAGPSKWATTMGRISDSDRAASLSKASSNITASMISTWSSATRAVSHARIPSGGMPSSISASSLFSRKTQDEEDRGETYTSLPSTPRRSGKAAFSPPMEHSPLASTSRHAKYTPDRGSVPGPKRSESITSTASVSSLQERLAALTHAVSPSTTPARKTGPRQLLLSSSASTRRVSVPASISRHRSPSSSQSPSPTKQRQSMPLPDIGRGFPSVFNDSPPNGTAQSTLSPPLQVEPAVLYRTTSNSSVGLYRVMSGEQEDDRKVRRLSDTQERERGEEGGLYKINSRPRSPVPPLMPRSRAASPALSEGRAPGQENGVSGAVKGPRGPRPGGPRRLESAYEMAGADE